MSVDERVAALTQKMLRRKFYAVLSKASVSKPWVQTEMASAIMRQKSESTVRLLPILKEDCDIPPLLSGIRYADFRVSFQTGINELLQGLQGIRPRRDRPSAARQQHPADGAPLRG